MSAHALGVSGVKIRIYLKTTIIYPKIIDCEKSNIH